MLNIKNTAIRSQYNRIKAVRAAAKGGQGAKVVEIQCCGGCGATQRLRADKVKAGHVFICNARATRDLCKLRIPHAINGHVARFQYQAAGAFTGVEYRKAGSIALSLAAAAELVRLPLASLTFWLNKRQKSIEAAKRQGNE
ncbi:MAG: hypothetical protein ACRDDI_13660 [Aeromonas veronii]